MLIIQAGYPYLTIDVSQRGDYFESLEEDTNLIRNAGTLSMRGATAQSVENTGTFNMQYDGNCNNNTYSTLTTYLYNAGTANIENGYNGKPSVCEDYEVGTIIFTPISNILDNYFEFAHNIDIVKNSNPW